MADDRATIFLRVDKDLKKELKLISVYEEVSVTEIMLGFIEYGLRKYNEDKTLIK